MGERELWLGRRKDVRKCLLILVLCLIKKEWVFAMATATCSSIVRAQKHSQMRSILRDVWFLTIYTALDEEDRQKANPVIMPTTTTKPWPLIKRERVC